MDRDEILAPIQLDPDAWPSLSGSEDERGELDFVFDRIHDKTVAEPDEQGRELDADEIREMIAEARKRAATRLRKDLDFPSDDDDSYAGRDEDVLASPNDDLQDLFAEREREERAAAEAEAERLKVRRLAYNLQ